VLFSKIITLTKLGPVEATKLLYRRIVLPNIMFDYTKKYQANQINLPVFKFEALKQHSNAILANNVTLWGKQFFLGADIEWKKDYFSGYTWPKKYFKELRKLTLVGVDIKFPWELSRFHQAVWLADSYNLQNNEQYAIKFSALIGDWISDNSFLYSVNWTCAMDVGIRAVNLIYAFTLFKQSNYCFDDDFENNFLKLIYKHGLYIYHNQEYSPVRGNHYTSDLVGLFIIGLLFQKTSVGRKWLNFAKKELEQEIELQTLDSGMNFELSLPYHRLTTELFLYSYIFGKLNNVNFSENYLRILKKQVQFIVDYTKPNNLAPLVGDNDSGHLFYFPCFDNRDHIFLLDIGKKYLEFKPKKKSGFIEYKDAGFVIYKDKRIYFLFKNSQLGLNGLGGHNHNDNLSFELNIDGLDIFVDPGTYVYTPKPNERNKFRSTEMHNTVYLGVEQNDLTQGIFILKSLSKPKYLKYSLKKMELKGELVYNQGFVYKRIVKIEKTQITISDRLSNFSGNAIFNLVLSPDLKIKKDKSLKVNEVIFSNKTLIVNPNVLLETHYSKDYYSIQPTKKISIPFYKSIDFYVVLGD